MCEMKIGDRLEEEEGEEFLFFFITIVLKIELHIYTHYKH